MKALLAKIPRLCVALASRRQNLWFRLLGCDLRGYAWMRKVRIPRQWEDITIEAGVAMDEGVTLLVSGEPAAGKIKLGQSVYINRYTILDASDSIVVGRETMIGPYCYLTDHDHAYACGESPTTGTLVSSPTVIGERVWLGARVTVLKGVHIGDNAIIGAGSVVTRDIPANSLALGTPARVARQLDKS